MRSSGLAFAQLSQGARTGQPIRFARPSGVAKLSGSAQMQLRFRSVVLMALVAPSLGAWAAGDLARGAEAARTCMACHAFTPGRHLTGPSLAGVVGRKAGTAEGFHRYSPALQHSGIVWTAAELDAWLKNPAALVPGNAMNFPGIANDGTRADLVAYLQAISSGKAPAPAVALPDLKKAGAAERIVALSYCGDAYRVHTADRQTHVFWEFNLRFKTDGSAEGPQAGHPVIVGTGMRGDRAAVVFSNPQDISTFIRKDCP
jgi:cytochrome c